MQLLINSPVIIDTIFNNVKVKTLNVMRTKSRLLRRTIRKPKSKSRRVSFAFVPNQSPTLQVKNKVNNKFKDLLFTLHMVTSQTPYEIKQLLVLISRFGKKDF